jgi:hypothetical protein
LSEWQSILMLKSIANLWITALCCYSWFFVWIFWKQREVVLWLSKNCYDYLIQSLYPRSPKGDGGILFYLCPSVHPSIQNIFRYIFLSNCWWQKSDIWSQASYRYTILWVAFLDPSDSYFLFADLVGFYTHWTYMHIFLSNYWWQKTDIWSQASYRYPISWEAFLNPSDSYFLFVDFVDFYTHWTYMLIFRRIFLSNYWWQKSNIWSQATYRYPISWEAFLDPWDSYFLFADFVDFYTHLTYICICTFFVAFF